MKKTVIFVLIFAIIVSGIFLYKMDKKNIEDGFEPKYCIRIVNEEKKEIKYLGLGYSLYRKYNKSSNENLKESNELKFGIWFLGKKEVKFND